DRPEDLLGILDVDVPSQREPEEAHGLLAMDHRDEARLATLLESSEGPVPPEREHLFLVKRNEELGEHEEPDQPGQSTTPECALRDCSVVSYSFERMAAPRAVIFDLGGTLVHWSDWE